jgi:O-antigen/teichoic acid export membrane protein
MNFTSHSFFKVNINRNFEINRPEKIEFNTFLNFLGNFIPLLIGFVAIPFTIKGLGQERFGLLSLCWTLLTYFSFFDLGLGKATTKFVAESLGKNQKANISLLFWLSFFLNIIIGIVAGAILYFLTPILTNNIFNISMKYIAEAQASFAILAFFLPIIVTSAALRGLLEAYFRFDIVNIIKIFTNSFIFLIPLISYFFYTSLSLIIFLICLSRLLAFSLFAYHAFRIINQYKPAAPVVKIMRSIISFAIWITLSNVFGPILVYADRFFIAHILSMKYVAFFTAPFEIVTRLWILPSSLVNTLFPTFSYYSTQDKERTILYYNNSIKFLAIFMAALIIPLILFSDKILILWLGTDFHQKSNLLFQLLSIGVFINSIAWVPFTFLQSSGRADLPAKIHLLEFIFYFFLLAFLLKNYGLIGAAIAFIVRVSIESILLFTSVNYKCKIKLFNNVLFCILFNISIFFTLLFVNISGSFITRVTLGMIIYSTFGLIVMFIFLDNNQRNNFLSLIKRFFKQRVNL